MKIHKQLMLLIGVGMLLMLAVTVLSLWYVANSFTATTGQIGRLTAESERLWAIERRIDALAGAVQNYVMTGDRHHERVYRNEQAETDRIVEFLSSTGSAGGRETEVLKRLSGDMQRMKEKSERIFSLAHPAGEHRTLAVNLQNELSGLHLWMERDIERLQNANASEMARVLYHLDRNNLRVNLDFMLILIASLGSLIAFVLYFRTTVSLPLKDLWDGAEEISRGNLDYQVQVRGEGDIARLAERFNEMAQRLRASYSDLEQKLLERTHELASLDAVALTLSQAGTLKDVLDKSLLRILDSLSGIQAKGGVFLCEPGGEVLRLVSHRGLPSEFVQRESEIRMGECLCGIVAQTGELLYSEQTCQDPRHSRSVGEDSHAHIIIPIKSRGIVLGVIFLYPQKNFTLKPSDIQMLDAMGVQLGMAVENFRFYAEVKESSEKYWDLFENATDILFTMDGTGRLTAVNKAAERFSGYTRVELAGKSVFELLTPEGAETARTMLAEGSPEGNWTEFEVVKRDGTRAFIEASVRTLHRQDQAAGYQVSARDVTEQKRLREMLLQAERLGAIGQVVVTVRHEINNPLTTVIGNIELLMERYQDKDPDLTARLETALKNALRIAEIVKQLQGIKKDKVVEYLKGVPMTDLKQK
jgi:PAS domain S-box-containing protein